MKRVIGFDVSSSNVGYSVIDYDDKEIKLIDYGVISPLKKNKGSILFRLSDLKFKILNLLKSYSPDDVTIEEIIQFMKGKSSAATIITLACFNRMIGLACMEFMLKEPKMLSVMTIRSKLKINGKTPSKEEIPKAIEHNLNIKFPWIMKKNRKTQILEIDKKSYDLADGIAVAVAFIKSQKSAPKKKKK